MKYATAALAALLPLSAAYALQTPQPAVPLEKGGDPHVRVAIYNPAEQVLLVGAVNRPTVIVFGAGEHIQRVALEPATTVDGKAVPAPWQGIEGDQVAQQPLRNVLPLWAMRAGRSNAQVITRDESGATRVYLFQLMALPPQLNECNLDDCDDPRLMTSLSFVYPNERKAEIRQAAAKKIEVSQKLAAEDRLKTDPFYGERNWKYVARGTAEAKRLLAPDEISDNTQTTVFRYLGRRKVPSIYVVERGQERLVTPVAQKDMLVVQETAEHWRLRDGEDRNSVLDIDNRGYDAIGANPWTGTSSPDVIRVMRTETRK